MIQISSISPDSHYKKYLDPEINFEMMDYFNDLHASVVKDVPDLSSFGVNYIQNKDFFRSPELSKVDLLISGCSQTFGVGMKEDLIWPTLLARESDLSYNNLAFPGGSAESIVDNIFRHIYKFGKPKYLRVLFPDMFRFVFLENRFAKLPVVPSSYSSNEIRFVDCQTVFHPRVTEKYYAPPILANSIMPRAIAFRRNIFSIKELEMFCKHANIDFKWSTWCDGFQGYLKENEKNMIFNNYVKRSWYFMPKENRFWLGEDFVPLDKLCHKSLEELDPDLFMRAADYKFHKRNYHMGSHDHLHFSQLMRI